MKEYITKLLVAALVLSVTTACEKEYLVPEHSNFSDAVAVASGNKTIQRGDFTSFGDLSKGVTQRIWNIPESAAIINLEGKSPSELDIVYVQFDEPGTFEVNLQSEFEDTSIHLDTTFTVSVLDYIETNMEVPSIDAGFYEQTPKQIIMYEGGTITYNDVSLGRPNRRVWLFPGGDPLRAGGVSIAKDLEVKNMAVSYSNIGTYDVSLVTWRQFPEGSKDTLVLENYIKIIENLEPPTLVSITEDKEGVLYLAYNLPLKFTGDLTSNFTLKVAGSTVPISSIQSNADDARILEVMPVSNIDNSATATITYDGLGDLTRLNDVSVEAFTDEEITLFVAPNLADDTIYGFEDGGTGWSPAWVWDNVGLVSFTGDKAASGSYSMRMEATTDAKWCRSYSRIDGSTFVLESGKNYTIEYKIWIDPSYTDSSIEPWILGEDSWVGTGFWTGLNGLPRSQWVTINKELQKTFSPPTTTTYFMTFRFEKIGVIYIDDVKVYEVD